MNGRIKRRIGVWLFGGPPPTGRSRLYQIVKFITLLIAPVGMAYGVKNAVTSAQLVFLVGKLGLWLEAVEHLGMIVFYLSIARANLSWFAEALRVIFPDAVDRLPNRQEHRQQEPDGSGHAEPDGPPPRLQ